MYKYIYPKLTEHKDFGLFRLGGPGLANCIMISMRAYISSVNEDVLFVAPTWAKISIGPLLRREKDKRHYVGLFNNLGISGLRKFLILIFSKRVFYVEGMGNYFEELKNNYTLVKKYFYRIVKNKFVQRIKKENFDHVIGVHIRMGDYKGTTYETDIGFYKKVILEIKNISPKYKFFLYSDADDTDIESITSIEGVERRFFGNALSDILALSRSSLIVASDSTFSAIASFIEQVPIIFSKRHFNSPLINEDNEFILERSGETSSNNLKIFLKKIL